MQLMKIIRALILCALALCSRRVLADTHTNLIFNVSIGLSVVQQDFVPISTNEFFYVTRNSSFGGQDIANALAGTPLFKTNHLGGAKLLYRVADLGATNQHPSFILRKGTNDFDMKDYMYLSFPELSVTSKAPGAGGTTNATDYTTLEVNLSGTPGGYFDGKGFCIVKNTSIFNGRTLIQAQEFPATITANLAGTGTTGGKTSMFRGTIVISGRRVEIKDY
jgi:hypothetical protein